MPSNEHEHEWVLEEVKKEGGNELSTYRCACGARWHFPSRVIFNRTTAVFHEWKLVEEREDLRSNGERIVWQEWLCERCFKQARTSPPFRPVAMDCLSTPVQTPRCDVHPVQMDFVPPRAVTDRVATVTFRCPIESCDQSQTIVVEIR